MALIETFKINSLRRYLSDSVMPLGILVIVAMLVLPLPTFLLDVFFSFNILLALLVLMIAIHSFRPLDFSSFPTLLLVATVLRLALNVASTRIVLANGHTGTDAAGQVIEAFGSFVIAGNFVVGIFVFAILVIINLVVITKGAGRVSEVTARFTLDSMPGKQMAIDADLNAGMAATAEKFGMDYAFHDESVKMKVVIMVSRFGHCLNDLLYRWKIGALPIDIVAVISNHMDYQKVVVNHDLPFHCIKVTKENKPQAEAAIMQVVEDTEAELIVLARYMQVLSDDLCTKMSGKIINIHHSFLPSFKGANPYKQAYERGVKLIGATAHYVTADLDEGPIIEQDTIRVTHAQSPEDYVSLGRDVEAQVLARAIHAHVNGRVFLNENKTVVFPPSPGSYASERMG